MVDDRLSGRAGPRGYVSRIRGAALGRRTHRVRGCSANTHWPLQGSHQVLGQSTTEPVASLSVSASWCSCGITFMNGRR